MNQGKWLYTAIFILLFQVASAQQTTLNHHPLNDTYLKLNLAGLIDPGSPSAQVGLEKRFNKNWAAEATVGIGSYLLFPDKNKDSFYHANTKYKLQVKKYIKARGVYMAVEFFNTTLKYNDFYGRYRSDDVYAYDRADYKKSIWGQSLKWGRLIPLFSKCYMEPAVALGIRWVHTTVKAWNAQPSFPRSTDWADFTTNIGHKVTPHTAYEFKFVYSIN